MNLQNLRRVGGGNINDAYRAELDGRPVFVKTRDDVSPGEYEVEAAGLPWLAEPAALQVPEVIAHDDTRLVLEWIDEGHPTPAGEEELGHGLAELHRAGADAFGGPQDLRIGPLRLPNGPSDDWPSFYADCRLRPLCKKGDGSESCTPGARSGTVPFLARLEEVCERMGELAGPAEPPARLHGDLWGGNVLWAEDGRPWLIDPAAYGGHREVDLAMLALFTRPTSSASTSGGLTPRVLAAYQEAWPLADGWEERVPLWQLFPLLVHVSLFGGGYVGSTERAVDRVLSR